MGEKKPSPERPDPDKLAALKSLPMEIVDSFTKAELHAFLYEDVWPDSLQEKLKNYIVEE
ncbi:MAG: hypothetical protein PVJ69_11145 [Desulfobacteraceae bacterium]|jgi:hypothetical protein